MIQEALPIVSKKLQFPHDDIRILTGVDQVLENLFGCRHQWGFPLTSKDMREHYKVVAPFNSHQTCTNCGRHRFFNFQTVEPGPMFTKRAKI